MSLLKAYIKYLLAAFVLLGVECGAFVTFPVMGVVIGIVSGFSPWFFGYMKVCGVVIGALTIAIGTINFFEDNKKPFRCIGRYIERMSDKGKKWKENLKKSAKGDLR